MCRNHGFPEVDPVWREDVEARGFDSELPDDPKRGVGPDEEPFERRIDAGNQISIESALNDCVLRRVVRDRFRANASLIDYDRNDVHRAHDRGPGRPFEHRRICIVNGYRS